MGGKAQPSKLLAPGNSNGPVGSSRSSSNIHTGADAASGEVPSVSKDTFLNRLPKSVIHHGRVIDIRAGLASQLTTEVEGVKVAVVETPVVEEMQQRLNASMSGSADGLTFPLFFPW